MQLLRLAPPPLPQDIAIRDKPTFPGNTGKLRPWLTTQSGTHMHKMVCILKGVMISIFKAEFTLPYKPREKETAPSKCEAR